MQTSDRGDRERYRARVRGCLLGGAIGDALGAPIEFDTLAVIREDHGPAGLAELIEAFGRRGAVTDDTQMTLFVVEGLIRAGLDPAEAPDEVWRATRRWYLTQTAPVPPPEVDGWLGREHWLYSQRAPGNACMGAFAGNPTGPPAHQVNPESKGCGTVMRSAPYGLLPALTPDQAFDLAARCSRHTHGHPTAAQASGAFALIVRQLLDGAPLPGALATALHRLAEEPDGTETHAALATARDLAVAGPPEATTLERLGGGWTGEQALAIAVYAGLSHPADPRSALLLAVNHSGDSDSTGAICGNLLGASLGEDALPAGWLVAVEGRAPITLLADDLALAALHGDELAADPTWRSRYPTR